VRVREVMGVWGGRALGMWARVVHQGCGWEDRVWVWKSNTYNIRQVKEDRVWVWKSETYNIRQVKEDRVWVWKSNTYNIRQVVGLKC
jgi:hypothetical protein